MLWRMKPMEGGKTGPTHCYVLSVEQYHNIEAILITSPTQSQWLILILYFILYDNKRETICVSRMNCMVQVYPSVIDTLLLYTVMDATVLRWFVLVHLALYQMSTIGQKYSQAFITILSLLFHYCNQRTKYNNKNIVLKYHAKINLVFFATIPT